MKTPFGVILAGGQAQRMGGGDKGRLILGNKSLFNRVIERLKPQVGLISLNANGHPERFADLGLPVIADNTPGFLGPLAGILSGLDWAYEQGAELIVTVAADTPFFPCDFVVKLLEAGKDMDKPLVLAATYDKAGNIRCHPTFGLWPVTLRDDLRESLNSGLRKVILWTSRHGGCEALYETAIIDPFFNINTPEDLNVAKQFLEAGA